MNSVMSRMQSASCTTSISMPRLRRSRPEGKVRSFEALDFDVAEYDRGAFGLQQDMALARFRVRSRVDVRTVDQQLDRVGPASDFVLVPFADRLFIFLTGRGESV